MTLTSRPGLVERPVLVCGSEQAGVRCDRRAGRGASASGGMVVMARGCAGSRPAAQESPPMTFGSAVEVAADGGPRGGVEEAATQGRAGSRPCSVAGRSADGRSRPPGAGRVDGAPQRAIFLQRRGQGVLPVGTGAVVLTRLTKTGSKMVMAFYRKLICGKRYPGASANPMPSSMVTKLGRIGPENDTTSSARRGVSSFDRPQLTLH
jgi:hypothetical protein